MLGDLRACRWHFRVSDFLAVSEGGGLKPEIPSKIILNEELVGSAKNANRISEQKREQQRQLQMQQIAKELLERQEKQRKEEIERHEKQRKEEEEQKKKKLKDQEEEMKEIKAQLEKLLEDLKSKGVSFF